MVQSVERGASEYGLNHHGIEPSLTVYWNQTAPALVEAALLRGEAELSSHGALSASTGEFTGRSPKDKFIVREPASEEHIDWGPVNQPIEADVFERLHAKVVAHLNARELFVQDLNVGADEQHRMPLRVVCERAWHALFARIMFIRPERDSLATHVPEFTVLHAPSLEADPAVDGTRSSTFIVVSFEKKLILVGGTEYAGEIKKSIFSIMNYRLPLDGAMSMHCSANVGPNDDVALFFGLSGTGKTTLSSDPKRTLIGDDEHGWTERGTFNFEGGCYAKVINLSETAEPEIYAATRTFGTVLENVVLEDDTRLIRYEDDTKTENTRAAYPLDSIPNASRTGMAGHPKNIIFLSADAFGVLPPISRLTPEQASYYFLSGYTAKVAGTERGLTEPEATFSTCFGDPFLTLAPNAYGRLLAAKVREHRPNVWLVNTGWTGGRYGVGERMPIKYTRAMISAALEGQLDGVDYVEDPIFGVQVPTEVPGVPNEALIPRNGWADKDAFDSTARGLARDFRDNFAQYADTVDQEIVDAGPRAE